MQISTNPSKIDISWQARRTKRALQAVLTQTPTWGAHSIVPNIA